VLNVIKKHDCSKFYIKNAAVQYLFKSFTMRGKLMLKNEERIHQNGMHS
jgi:hypothetical protein